MRLPRWFLPGLQKRSDAGSRASVEVRLRVRNQTRETVLAASLEVADSSSKRSKGLLGRTGLATGGGLWIVPCESVHTIGMQFAIDLVYLDRKCRVRKVRSNVGPWRISACLSAHSILELPVGTIRDTETSCGDLLEIVPAVADDVCVASSFEEEREALGALR